MSVPLMLCALTAPCICVRKLVFFSSWMRNTCDSPGFDPWQELSHQYHPPLSSSSKDKLSALLTAAKNGNGNLDKAMRYLLDSDSTPDKCSVPIQSGSLACNTPAMNHVQWSLGHPQCSHTVDP